MARPPSIVAFERLFLFTIAVGVLQAVSGWDELSRRAAPATILFMLLLTFATQAALVLLASRAANGAARWVLLALLVLGLPLFLTSLKRGTVIGSEWLSLGQAALQAASVALLFTPTARRWFAEEARRLRQP